MLSFKQYLTEAKNTHLTHVMDLVFMEGVDGTRKAINFLRSVRDMLNNSGG
jgi:glycerol-3-phosphate responsive antiterminator